MPLLFDALKYSLRAGRWLAYQLLSLHDRGPILNYGIVQKGVLSRSGRPDAHALEWLADMGVKTLVNLCAELDEREAAQHSGLAYFHLPIIDGFFPSDEQAHRFLQLVTDPANRPVHIHCYAGAGRSGLMTALFRYAVQGWPMDEAIEEATSYFPGLTPVQVSWLRTWAKGQESRGK